METPRKRIGISMIFQAKSERWQKALLEQPRSKECGTENYRLASIMTGALRTPRVRGESCYYVAFGLLFTEQEKVTWSKHSSSL